MLRCAQQGTAAGDASLKPLKIKCFSLGSLCHRLFQSMPREILDAQEAAPRTPNILSKAWLYLAIALFIGAGLRKMMKPDGSFEIQLHDTYIITSVWQIFFVLGFFSLVLHYWYKKFGSLYFGWLQMGCHLVFAPALWFSMAEDGLAQVSQDEGIIKDIAGWSCLLLILFYLLFPIYALFKTMRKYLELP